MSGLVILDDARSRPELFHWFGPIAPGVLDAWLREHGLDGRVPRDLVALWQATGGGDYFDTDTILGPFGNPDLGDDVVGMNAGLHADGLHQDFLVFSSGLVRGGVDMRTGEFVEFEGVAYVATKRFSSFDDWYIGTVRAAYEEGYGLPPVKRGR